MTGRAMGSHQSAAAITTTWLTPPAITTALGGPVVLSDAYRYFARHPKARGRQHWRPQVRKVLQQVGRRVGPATYAAAAA